MKTNKSHYIAAASIKQNAFNRSVYVCMLVSVYFAICTAYVVRFFSLLCFGTPLDNQCSILVNVSRSIRCQKRNERQTAFLLSMCRSDDSIAKISTSLYSGHRKATEEKGEQCTPGKAIWKKEMRAVMYSWSGGRWA